MIDPIALKIIENRAALFTATKERVVARIKENVAIAIGKLKAAERELLDQVEDEFGVNPFEELLNGIRSDINYSGDDIQRILTHKFPTEFGPSEESFRSLCKEIEAFKSWEVPKEKRPCLDLIPKNIKSTNVTSERISISWDGVEENCFYEIEIKSPGLINHHHSLKPEYTFSGLEPNTKYYIRVRVIMQDDNRCIWSDPIKVQTRQGFFSCEWKECPKRINPDFEYSVDQNNPRIATKFSYSGKWCSIIGDTSLPPNRVTSWDIKLLRMLRNNGYGIFIGVAPFDIKQNCSRNFEKCGWYFYCYESELWSGPPHKYSRREIGPRRWFTGYVNIRDSVGVTMDTIKGKLSFSLGDLDLGVAYDGIPLDKPLVPCVLLNCANDSVELLVRKEPDPAVLKHYHYFF